MAPETHNALEKRSDSLFPLTGKKCMLAKHTLFKGHSKGTGRDHQGCCDSWENVDSMADSRQSQCKQQTREREQDIHLCSTELWNKGDWRHQGGRSDQACRLASSGQYAVTWHPKWNLLWCDSPTHWLRKDLIQSMASPLTALSPGHLAQHLAHSRCSVKFVK